MTRMTYVVVPKMLDCATWILDAKFLIIISDAFRSNTSI